MRRALVVVPLLLTFAGCTSADDASPSTSAAVTSPPTRATTASTVTESTDTAPNTTPTTTETTTSSVSTAAPDSNEPSTDTTIRPPTAEEQAVIDAVEASWQAWNNVLLDPTDAGRVEEIALTHTGQALQRVVDIVARWRIENRTSITHPEFPSYIRPDAASITVDLDSGVAEIEYCHLDSNVAVEVGGNDDGTDRVLDDSVSIRFEHETFELIDGRWLKSDGTSLGESEGETECPA